MFDSGERRIVVDVQAGETGDGTDTTVKVELTKNEQVIWSTEQQITLAPRGG